MGKFTDKLLGMLRLNEDDYDDYEDDYYDEEDDYEDESPRASVKAEEKETLRSERVHTSKRNYDDAYDNYEEEAAPSVAPKKVQRRAASSKVVPMRSARTGNMEVFVSKPSDFDEAKDIADTLLSGRAVVLNVEGLHVDLAQRIIDFAAGSCWAIHGNLKRITNYIFIFTPSNVDISGDFSDLLDNSFNMTSM